ncbi:hypothetical protein [Brasilonema bromeliae]|uniref:hypothetical protein n=1 Tax=Brasilonema bromeliae TaxID=383615 RepID=UPI001B7D0A20|nr:hypothetical protein [Brasilonema bromeliae]
MTSFFAVAFLGTLPAIAELGTVWTDFQLYTTDFRNYITNNISETLNPVELQTQSAITSSSGDLNLPNPNYASQYTRDQITQYSISDKFENNPAVYGKQVSSEINRYITRSAVEGVFGRDGQTRLKGKLQNTEQAVNKSNRAANTAQQKYSEIQSQSQSQGAMCSTPGVGNNNLANVCDQAQFLMMQGLVELELQNINIQREQTKITGETLGNTIQLRNDIQYSNLNLADISQQMNEVNRARRVGTSAEVARLLRVTSQTDLFRKSSNPLPLQTNPPSSENNPSPTETNPPSSENIPSPLETP